LLTVKFSRPYDAAPPHRRTAAPLQPPLPTFLFCSVSNAKLASYADNATKVSTARAVYGDIYGSTSVKIHVKGQHRNSSLAQQPRSDSQVTTAHLRCTLLSTRLAKGNLTPTSTPRPLRPAKRRLLLDLGMQIL